MEKTSQQTQANEGRSPDVGSSDGFGPCYVGIPDGESYRWSFDAPWNVMTLASWVWHSWLNTLPRKSDGAAVAHNGWRFFGVRCDTWFVRPNAAGQPRDQQP